ncbi:MAG: DUF4180 domain-containing protein [Acidobacteriaceae bacterium]
MSGIRVLEIDPSGPPLGSERDAVDLVGQAAENKAEMVALPSERLATFFFELKTRVAGEMVQKFSIYGVRVAIVGDVSAVIQSSCSFRDFVRESNRGKAIWFVANIEELKERLLSGK